MIAVDLYIANAAPDRQIILRMLRAILRDTLIPLWYEECINYGMIGYVVPHSLYQKGYHVDPNLPLPFVAIANQKSGIHLYHLGIYANPKLLWWWQSAYSQQNIGKLDMGKSCIRFKNLAKIPYDLIRELMTQMSALDWIKLYETSRT